MREILFRGKRIDSGEWVEGHYGEYMLMSGESIPCISIPNKEAVCGSTCCDVEASTVGQYTGMTDKNSKKIFENDICRFDNGEEFKDKDRFSNYVVQWDSVNTRYVVVDEWNCEDILDDFFSRHAVVIGNTHDTPELLEGKS